MAGRIKDYRTYEDLIKMIKSSEREFDIEEIEKVYNFALKSHGEQQRKSGLPYILHPVSVACILVDLGMDTESIQAALLHDVVEDTDVELSEVEKLFGKTVANLTNGVTKLSKIPYSSREEHQAENLRKMLIAMSEDIRVIIIKLADRLHNMRTIDCMPEQKRRDKALENMEVYAPIAHRLGIRAIKEELEDISLRQLDPVAYKEIEHNLEIKKSDREKLIKIIIRRVKDRVSQYIPDIQVTGRVKSINGIYRKLIMQGKLMEEIYDIYAVRVIVDNVNDCYNVLGIIHDIFTPLPNRFKDYISMPKPNMYRSLHTTVIGKEGVPFEVQIRTWEMHQTAEYGIAAHWKYKLGMNSGDRKTSFEEQLTWIRKMLENQADSEDSTDLIRTIKSDLVPEEVFVFTPKGDVISLPAGSTVIDFAYAIHSEVGNKMVGAKVDKRIVPIEYKIKMGEIIEILTTKEPSHGPSRDWLKIVKTSEARNKIRQWFKRERREENIAEGKAEIEREFKRNSIMLPEGDMKEFLEAIAKRQHCKSIEDLYASIGYGGTQLWRMIPKIRDEYSKIKRPVEKPVEPEIKEGLASKKVSGGVIVEGIDDCLVKLSKCCSPLPGDDIIGFITRGYGVSVHKKSCSNVPEDIKNCEEPDRWINVHWANTQKETFKSTLEILATDRTDLLADITVQLSSMRIFINSFNSRHTKDGNVLIYPTITVSGREHLDSVISKLLKVNGVISVERS